MNLGRESPSLVIHDDDATFRHGCDIRRATAAGQTGALAVFFDPVGVKIAEAIDFGTADESQIDAPRLQQIHDFVQTTAPERLRHIGWVAHGKDRSQRRPIADYAVFKNAQSVGRMGFFSDGEAEQR